MTHISVALLGYLLFNPIHVRPQPESQPQPGAKVVSFRQQLWVIGEKELQNCCQQVQKDHRRIYYLFNRSFRMNFLVKGIYTHQGLLFFRLALSNHSHLDYDVDSIRFFMRDRKAMNKIITMVRPIPSLYSFGNTRLVRGKSRDESVIVLPQFTLPADKRLVIEVSEKNGGRKLQLLVDNFTLLRSRLI